MWARRCTLVVLVLAAQHTSLLAALEWCAPLAWPGLASARLVSHVPGRAAPGAELLALRYTTPPRLGARGNVTVAVK